MAIDRSNEQWLAELAEENSPDQAAALDDLQTYLRRGIYYYLSRERSDLATRNTEELEQMADDFAQDATLRILENLDSFRGDSRFTTWAMKIGTRTAISELRRARYKDFSLDTMSADGDLQVGLNVAEGTSRSAISPERATERADVARIITNALNTALTERQRTALEAVILQGVPMDVVAAQMGTNRNALYKLLHDARKKLKAHLEAEGIALNYILGLFE